MSDKRAEIIDWLHDAHAMERGLEISLKKQAESEAVLRAVRERARIHLDETIVHGERVARCLEMLGSSPSPVKIVAGQVMEAARGLTAKLSRDERIKDFLAACGAEYFEVACYKSLIAAANATALTDIVPLLEQNLKEDRAMAEWLDMNVDAITRDYLAQGAGPGAS